MTKTNLKKLNDLVDLVPQEKQVVAARLVEELVFMAETLADLKENIKQHGTIELFKQGSQEFYRESPAVKSYSTLIARYGNMYKQLVDLLPKTAPAPPESELLDFINQDE